MTGQTPQPPLPEPPSADAGDHPGKPSQSFAATPTDQARTYQTGRDQTIHEHHHYPPMPVAPAPASAPGSAKAGLTWSLVGAVILALGALVGVDLWERHKAADAGLVGEVATPVVTASAEEKPSSKGPSPSPSRSTVRSVSTEQALSESTEKAAEPPAPAQSASQPGPPPNPAQGCGPWRTADVSGVEIRSCGRVDGDRLYMIAEWRTTSGFQLVDVYLWLKDASGNEVVYPDSQSQKGKMFPSKEAWPTPHTHPQWQEYEVRQDLVHREKYQVCVTVRAEGGPGPKIYNPETKGVQYGITYP
ncbi:hypothetical protein ACIHCX_31435 [Streptomyces sp. NPDC052043]|uniref:hypothetical protein n=1 Tax=Streptomyces sp. NPDC052043 TaxID=3365684 RepID=UPI0037CF8B5B